MKEKDAMEDEFAIGVGPLDGTGQTSARFLFRFLTYLLEFFYNIVAHPFRVKAEQV